MMGSCRLLTQLVKAIQPSLSWTQWLVMYISAMCFFFPLLPSMFYFHMSILASDINFAGIPRDIMSQRSHFFSHGLLRTIVVLSYFHTVCSPDRYVPLLFPIHCRCQTGLFTNIKSLLLKHLTIFLSFWFKIKYFKKPP